MKWFVAVLKKYTDFSGRAQRAEYWYFILFYLLILIGLTIVDSISGSYDTETGMGALGAIFTLAMLIPSIAVGVRRLHDTDRTGWWLLIGLVPLVGAIVLLIFTVQNGTPDANRFGPDPKVLGT